MLRRMPGRTRNGLASSARSDRYALDSTPVDRKLFEKLTLIILIRSPVDRSKQNKSPYLRDDSATNSRSG